MKTFITKRAAEQNLKIVEARAPLTVEVDKGDIKKALKKNARCCAFARAAKRGQPEIKNAYFFRCTAYLEYADRMVRYHLPPSVQKEIVSFDRAKIMAPGTYQLSPKTKSQTLAALRSRKLGVTGRKQKYKPGVKRPLIHSTQMIRTFQDPENKAGA